MSVTFHLYKVRPDVHYLGTKYDTLSKEERQRINLLEYEEISTGEDMEEVREVRADRFSDGQVQYHGVFDGRKKEDHQLIDVTWFNILAKASSRNKGYKRLAKKLEQFSADIITHPHGYTIKYIVVDEILYRQGWFLKKNFFNHECTHYIATTKEEMIWFFHKYMENSVDTRGIEALNSFVETWDKYANEKLIFEVAF